MAPEEERSLGVILFRVAALEGQIKEMREEVRGGFAGLSFVRTDVYQSERQSSREYAEETRRIAEGARTVAWSSAALLLVSIGTLLAIIKAVAG